MNGKDAIIKKISEDASEKCAEIEKNAKGRIDLLISEAEEWAKDYSDAQEEILRKNAAEIVKRRLTVSELEVKKILLNAKQTLIGEVFLLAEEKLCSLPEDKYFGLLEKLLEEYAEDGDAVILPDDGRITFDKLKKLKVFGDKHLKAGVKRGEFKGGIKLTNEYCDKDLSFKSLINNKKDELSATVAETLFKD